MHMYSRQLCVCVCLCACVCLCVRTRERERKKERERRLCQIDFVHSKDFRCRMFSQFSV
jgi:hypothetical protein